MKETIVIGRLREFILTHLIERGPDFRLDDDTPLLGRGVLDSMAVMELVTFVRDGFGLWIAEEDIREKNFGSLRAVARYILQAHEHTAGVS